MKTTRVFLKAVKKQIIIILSLAFPILSMANAPNWESIPNLQFNMNITSKLELENESFSLNENDIIAGFVGDECRGMASPMEEFGGLIFLTIGSNVAFGEQIIFKAYLADEELVVDLDQTVEFENLGMIGTAGDPFVFTYSTQVYYSLSLSIVGNGSVEVDEEPYTEPITLEEGTVLSLEALADTGWQFDGWSGDHVSEHAEETITMEGDCTITATFILTIDSPGLTSEQLLVSPNPFSEKLRLENAGNVQRVSLTNLLGQEVYGMDNHRIEQIIIPASGMERGVYLLRVIDVSGVMQTFRVIKH